MKNMILSIVVLVGLFITFGLYKASQLQQIHIQKSVTIASDLSTTFDQVVYLENFPKWSPFLEIDPGQQYKVTGKDGTVGAQYHWEGNGGKDLGLQEIKVIRPLEYVKMECDIQKPFQANPTFEYTFTEEAGMVRVTQDFHLTSGLVDAFFMWAFGAKASMADMNARGLELLKQSIEQDQLVTN